MSLTVLIPPVNNFPAIRPSLRLPSWVWVILWTVLGVILRFWNLGDKVPWADEWSTILFSAGRGYGEIPLNALFSLETLLQPLQTPLPWQPAAVLERLQAESNHPPVFFLLSHLWFQLWLHLSPQESPLLPPVSARALSALLGSLTVPLSFAVAQQLGREHPQRSAFAHFTAILIALSPFGVYLAQEARHYTLTLGWILLLLWFLGQSVRSIQTQTPLPIAQVIGWISLNGLALGTHFFYGLARGGAGVGLGGIWLGEGVQRGWRRWGARYWGRLYAVGLGTAVVGGLWLSQWERQADRGLTQWLDRSRWGELETWGDRLVWLLEPVGRLVAWIVTMAMGAPLEGEPSIGVFMAAIGVLLLGLGAMVRLLWRARGSLRLPSMPSVLLLTVLAHSAMFLALVYGRGLDLTLAPRYQFVSLPGTVLLLAWSFALAWKQGQLGLNWQRGAVILVLGLGFWGSWSVVQNQLYQKPDQADVMIDRFQTVWQTDLSPAQRQAPFVLAFLHQNTGETGKLLSLGWEMQRNYAALPDRPDLPPNAQFFLAHWDHDRAEGSQALYQFLQTAPRPLSLWVVNFSAAPQDVAAFGCEYSTDRHPDALGYWSRLYFCPSSPPRSP